MYDLTQSYTHTTDDAIQSAADLINGKLDAKNGENRGEEKQIV